MKRSCNGRTANLVRGYTLTVGHLIQANGSVAIGGTPAAGDQASLAITLANGSSFTSSYTVQSAIDVWTGKGGFWKGRAQARIADA